MPPLAETPLRPSPSTTTVVVFFQSVSRCKATFFYNLNLHRGNTIERGSSVPPSRKTEGPPPDTFVCVDPCPNIVCTEYVPKSRDPWRKKSMTPSLVKIRSRLTERVVDRVGPEGNIGQGKTVVPHPTGSSDEILGRVRRTFVPLQLSSPRWELESPVID